MKNSIKLFSVIYRHGNIFFSNRLAELDITSGQFMFVRVVCDHPGLSQEEIASRVHMDKSTVAKVIQQLIQKGLVSREVDPADRRGYTVYPTAKGEEVYPEIMECVHAWDDLLQQGMSGEEKQVFETLMNRASTNVLSHFEKE